MKIPISKKYSKNTQKSKNNKKKGGESSQYCVYDKESQTLKGLCPGVKYFNEIKDSFVKDPDAVYTILGHGCDLMDEMIKLPPNCKYITRTACGLSVADTGDLEKKGKVGEYFADDFLFNKLETPVSIDNLRKYERKQGVDTYLIADYNKMGLRTLQNPSNVLLQLQTWNIHNEGEYFVNNKNWCFFELGNPAGLRKLGIVAYGSTPYIKDHGITFRSYALLHFEGSLFPTCHQVSKILDENFSKEELDSYDYNTTKDRLKEIFKNTFSIDYATIVNNLVGTFINSACRPICKGPNTKEDIYGEIDKFVQLSRSKSGRDNSKTIYEVDSKFALKEDNYLTPELKSKLEKYEK